MDWRSHYPNWPAVESLFVKYDEGNRPRKFSKERLSEIAGINRSRFTNKLNGTSPSRAQTRADREAHFAGLERVLVYIKAEERELMMRDGRELTLADFVLPEAPRKTRSARRARPLNERHAEIYWLTELEGPLAEEWKRLYEHEFGYYGQARDEFKKIRHWLHWSDQAARRVCDVSTAWMRFILGGAYNRDGKCLALASCAIDLDSGFIYANYVAIADWPYLEDLQEIDFNQWIEQIRLECQRVMTQAASKGCVVADHLTFVYEVDAPPPRVWEAALLHAARQGLTDAEFDDSESTRKAIAMTFRTIKDDDLVACWAALRRVRAYFKHLNSGLVCGTGGPLKFDFWWPRAGDKDPKPTPSWWMASGRHLGELQSAAGVRRIRDFMYNKAYGALVAPLVEHTDGYWSRVEDEKQKVIAASEGGALDHVHNVWAARTPLKRSLPGEPIYDSVFRLVWRELKHRGIDAPSAWANKRSCNSGQP